MATTEGGRLTYRDVLDLVADGDLQAVASAAHVYLDADKLPPNTVNILVQAHENPDLGSTLVVRGTILVVWRELARLVLDQHEERGV